MKKILLTSLFTVLLLAGCRESPENIEEDPDGQIETPTEEIHEDDLETDSDAS